MKTRRMIFVALVMALLVGITGADAAPLGTSIALSPWTAQTLDEEELDVKNLSTAFVGLDEIPFISWSRLGSTRIFQAHLATEAVPGNCGPDNGWYCTHWNDSHLISRRVSNVATFRYGPDTFGVKWVYLTSEGTLRGATVELRNDMSLVTNSWEDLIDLSKFGGVLVGEPSLVMVGGGYYLAAVIRSGSGDFPLHKLVYMYRTGTPNTSCTTSGTSSYQCDVIDTSYGYGSMGSPSLQIVDGTVGIAFYKLNKVMYAYPWEDVLFRPANCDSSGEDTYRCIPIWEEGTSGENVKLAFGPTPSDKGIAFTNDDELMDALFVAEYVGSGGDCGPDGKTFQFPSKTIYRWQCSVVYGLGVVPEILETPFSIAIDPEAYPLISFQQDDVLMLANPNARLGKSDPGWTAQKIDGNQWSNTGTQNALSINSAGLWFIGYMQPKYVYCSGDLCGTDSTPNLRYALQLEVKSRIFLPMITN